MLLSVFCVENANISCGLSFLHGFFIKQQILLKIIHFDVPMRGIDKYLSISSIVAN